LLAYLGSIKPRVQPIGAELRISLTLAIDNGDDIREEIRQVVFGAFAPAPGKIVEADTPAIEFVQAFANGFTVPPEFAFGTALAAGASTWHNAAVV